MFFKKPKTPAALPHDPFASIDAAQLDTVAGGASRVSSRSGGDSSQLTAMLSQITDSIKGLASQDSGGMDPMMMMMMMGMGGGGGSAAPPPAPAQPAMPIINVTTKRC